MRNPSKATAISPNSTVSANRYRTTRFAISVNAFSRLPPDTGREVAFAGRSNAGKSSALNRLTSQHSLARTSKTPGRTQLLNFFQVAPERYLVDLPGYGYAQVAETLRHQWQILLARYLRERQALRGLLLLMDCRHPPTVLDQQLLNVCAMRALPVHILLTKADKLGRGKGAIVLRQLQSTLHTQLPGVSGLSAQLFSSLNGEGVETAWLRLDEWLGY